MLSQEDQNRAAAAALHTMHYNFVRIHQTLRVAPAMPAGVTDRVREVYTWWPCWKRQSRG
jgi:hypothetical protein